MIVWRRWASRWSGYALAASMALSSSVGCAGESEAGARLDLEPADASASVAQRLFLLAEKTPQKPAANTGKTITSPIEDARVNPQIYVPPAKDLELSPDNAKRADALALYVEGWMLQEEGEPDKALAAFVKSLELDPTNVALATTIAFEMGKRGDIAEAVGVLKDTAKAAPNAPEAQLALAFFYQRYLRKPELAEPYAQKALSLDPGNPQAYGYLAEIYLSRNDERKAEAVLEKALKTNNPKPEFWLGLASVYGQILIREDEDASEAAIKKVARFYEKAAEVGKDDPAVLTQVANFYAAAKQLSKAIPFYQRVLELKPESEDESLSTIREKLAISYLQNKDREKAIETLEDLVKRDPKRRFALELLGDIYLESKEEEKALAAYEAVLKLHPDASRNYLRVAQLLIKPEPKRAVEVLQEARKRFPKDLDFLLLLGAALRNDKRFTEALEVFDKARVETEQGNPPQRVGLFYFEYGVAAEQAGQFEKAAELFKRSIELDPTQPDSFNYLGYMWVDRNENLDEAGELIRRAVEMNPTNAAYIDSLGWFYYRKGNYERALTELLRACEFLPEPDPIVLDHVGDAYHKLGEDAQALLYWDKALKLDPENKTIPGKIEAVRKKVSSNP